MCYQLEIHHIDVTGGDATIILVRKNDGGKRPVVYSIVVDLGGIGRGPKKLNAYLDHFWNAGFRQDLDLLIISHYHDDHIAGVTFNNIDGTPKLRFKKIIDIGPAKESCYPTNRAVANATVTAQLQKDYRSYREYQMNNKCEPIILPFLEPNRDKEKALEIFEHQLMDGAERTGFSIKFLCGKGVLFNGEDPLKEQENTIGRNINANDLSIGFLLLGPEKEKERFTYFSAGDLSGDTPLQKYYNVEARLLKLMNEKGMLKENVKVFKAMHHGSKYNNHNDFGGGSLKVKGVLNTLNPELIIVPCNQHRQVPAADFLDNRLHPYLTKNNTAKAYFLNMLIYTKRLKERYKAFEKLSQLTKDKNKPTNVFFDKERKAYTISLTTSIILLYPAGKDSDAPDRYKKMERVDHSVFSTFFCDEEIDEGTNDYAVQDSPSQLKRPIPIRYIQSIQKGIDDQIEHLVEKLFKEKNADQLKIYDSYFDENLPALVAEKKLSEWKKESKRTVINEFKSKIEELTDATFFDNEDAWYLYTNEILDDDTEITLVTLIYHSETQILFLKSALYFNNYAELTKNLYNWLPPFDKTDKKREEIYDKVIKAEIMENEKPRRSVPRVDYNEMKADKYQPQSKRSKK